MSQKGVVLVIDDQADAREAVAAALEPLGYAVLAAGDGAAGLQLAVRCQPDVVLLDVQMPGLNGYQVCQRLKASEETKLIPVVFLTGFDSRQARLEGLEAGATDFLTKPFDLVELEVRVRNLVHFRQLTQDLDNAEGILLSMARAVEARDAGTGDHCDRLCGLAARLGQRLHLDPRDVKALHRAGFLHDIGKIGIPDAVLLKPGPLSPEEWAIMRSHVEIGYSMCAPLRSFRPVLPIIRHHHERMDGSGYPDGLRGEEIPYLARVFQVVDVYDALIHERPYRRPLPPAEAMAVLWEETRRGWWDPRIVEEFVQLVESEG